MKYKFKVLLSSYKNDAGTDKKLTITSSCFHPERSLVYCGLSSGTVLCYDYTSTTSSQGPVSEFPAHTGPVRVLAPHPRHALLASGGDDTRVCVWSASSGHRRQLSLRGHQDYVRALAWHPSYPWLVSGSDDTTVRIWNWQNRTEVITVTGCQHWVVSLALHVTRDLMVTASLDGSVRVWDFSSLRNRTCNVGKHSEVATLFGMLDVVCDKVIESFNEKIMFVTIHPTREVMAVGHGSQVTLYSLETYSVTNTIYGDRGGLVAGVWQGRGSAGSGTFDTLVTVYTDKVKMWAWEMGMCRDKMDSDTRYKGVTSDLGAGRHNYLAAWAGDQLSVFKVVKERPVMTGHLHHLYYVKHGTIRHYNLHRGKETVLFKLAQPEKGASYLSLEYNPSEHSLILNSNSKARINRDLYQLFVIVDGVVNGKPKTMLSQGHCGVWTAHNRFAHLDDHKNIIVKNLDNKNVNFGGFSSGFLLSKSEQSSQNYKAPNCDRLFPGGRPGCVLIQDGDIILHYDIVKRRRLHSSKFPELKRVCWSPDKSQVALASKNNVTICDASLKVLTTHSSRIPVKSLLWHPVPWSGPPVLLVSTHCQVRYLLTSGQEGAILTTQETIYLGAVTISEEEEAVSRLACVNRRQQVRVLEINNAEFIFKAAVIAGEEQQYLRLIASGKLLGQSQLSFLRDVGMPELAIMFIKDPQTRFSLALEANDLNAAFDAAKTLDSADSWIRLGQQSLLNGNLSMTEQCYQRGKAYTQLSFLYAVTGQDEKLEKLGRIFRVRGEWSNAMTTALLTQSKGIMAEILESAEMSSLDSAKVTEREADNPPLQSPVTSYQSCTSDWPMVDPQQEKDRKLDDKQRAQEIYRDQLRSSLK